MKLDFKYTNELVSYLLNIEKYKTALEYLYLPTRTKQKLMQENDDLRIYRNVYQKLLLRTRRNPNNEQYENDFNEFKQKISEKDEIK